MNAIYSVAGVDRGGEWEGEGLGVANLGCYLVGWEVVEYSVCWYKHLARCERFCMLFVCWCWS
jgi:hypothetical protein